MKSEAKPYEFTFTGGLNNTYVFVTNHKIAYEIKFKPSSYLFGYQSSFTEFAFEFVIAVAYNPTQTHPPLDSNIPSTIAAIFYDFFKLKDTVVVYICDNADGKAKARNRKFNQWFEQQNKLIFLKFDFMLGTSEEYYFTSIISRIDNPKLSEIITAFQNLTDDYKNKIE